MEDRIREAMALQARLAELRLELLAETDALVEERERARERAKAVTQLLGPASTRYRRDHRRRYYHAE